jgi:aspartyl-tRNA(Asn)/glutamyl-tRNA(Gln) amidotransferase subunit C
MGRVTEPPPDDDLALVKHVARLARLAVPEADLPRLAAEFARIRALLGQVAAIDVPRGVDPATAPPVAFESLREDAPGPTLTWPEALGNAPARDGAFFVVPPFFEDEGLEEGG